jgi:hypothetical protein
MNLLYAELAHLKSCFVNTGGLRSCAQDVGFCGCVVWRCDSIDFIKKAATKSVLGARYIKLAARDLLWRRVHQVELVLVIKHLRDAWIFP